jgi:hypothetical protein
MCRRKFHGFTEVVNDTLRTPDAVEFMVKAWDDADKNGIEEGHALLNEVVALLDADTD